MERAMLVYLQRISTEISKREYEVKGAMCNQEVFVNTQYLIKM